MSAAGKIGLGGSITAAALIVITAIFNVEGGYVNNKYDPGGPTNRGITEVVAREKGFEGDMKLLPKAFAQRVIYEDYIVKPGFAPLLDIDLPVAEELADTSVNMGPARPSRFFQTSINELAGVRIGVDGKVGAITIGAYRVYQSRVGKPVACRRMLDSLDAKQSAEYDRLVRVNPSLRTFRRGWQNHRIGNVDRARCGRLAA